MAADDLIRQLEKLILSAKVVPLTDEVRVSAQKVTQLIEGIQREAPAEGQEAAARLDRIVREAKRVPLTDQVRVDREEVLSLLDAVRAAAPRAAPVTEPPPSRPEAADDTAATLARLAELFGGTDAVALTSGRARVSREDVYELIDEIRMKLPTEPIVVRARPDGPDFLDLLDRLDDLIHEARSIPLTGTVIVKRTETLELVSQLQAELRRMLGTSG